MEVHHAKHPSHKKKWAEYLLEFFMLFFAVFLGFLTENVREHMIEHKKEKQLIVSLARDLEKDSSDLNHIISNMVLHDQWVDSAIIALRSGTIKGREKEIAYPLNNATIWQLYSAPDITINQIRTSGVFNLIKNESVRKGILDYMSNLNNYIKYSEPLIESRHTMDTSTVAIFTISDLRKMIGVVYKASRRGSDFIELADLDFPFVFKTYDPNVFRRLADKLEQVNYLETDMLGQYQRLLRFDVELLALLEKEYHLD